MQPGSLLECIKIGHWQNHAGYHKDGPKNGDMVICSGQSKIDSEFIYLLEYPECNCGCGRKAVFHKKNFREIQPPMDIKIEDIISEPVNV